MISRRIYFNRLAIDARIGILEHELRTTQPILIDLVCDVDIKQTVNDLDITTVLDYRAIRDCIIEECTRQHIHLIETLAEKLSQRLLDDFPDIRRVKITIGKPLAFSDCAAVGIEVTQERSFTS